MLNRFACLCKVNTLQSASRRLSSVFRCVHAERAQCCQCLSIQVTCCSASLGGVLDKQAIHILILKSRKRLVRELRSLPHRVSLGGGGGGVVRIGGFFGAGQNPIAKEACFGPDFGPFGEVAFWTSKGKPGLL